MKTPQQHVAAYKAQCTANHPARIMRALRAQGIEAVPLARDEETGDRFCPVCDPRENEWDRQWRRLNA
jgi:hypothetical protein